MVNRLFEEGKMVFSVIIDGKEIYPEYKITRAADSVSLNFKSSRFTDDISFSFLPDGVAVERRFENTDDQPIILNGLKATVLGIDFGGNKRDDYFYHAENPRIYETFTFPIDYKRTCADATDSAFDVVANNRWADPGVVSEYIGASPYQPFPALLISNYKSRMGIVHGTLCQDFFYHCYLLSHDSPEGGIKAEIFSCFKDTAFVKAGKGKVYIDKWYIGETRDADDIEKIFTGYTRELRKVLASNYGKKDINRHDLVWGTWNDGLFREVSEELVLQEAKAVKEYFPSVKWIQLDDGYAVYDKHAHGLGVPFEKNGIDRVKFPSGLKALADKIRDIGLKPAVWVGGFCPVETEIYKTHPDWFIDYSKRIDTSQPLDVSKPEVREYMLYAMRTFIKEYGFEGIKHDFWSYGFEDSDDLYSEKEYSGYELRKWWTGEIRKMLGEEGYFQTGCDLVQGNVFLGENFTNYRYGIDIGAGDWDTVKTVFLWGSACFATHTGDLCVPNSDAFGIFKRLPDNVFDFWNNYLIITRSAVELSGRFSLEENRNTPRFKKLQKATCNPNNGQDVHFVGFDYRQKGRVVPEIMYIKTAHFSTQADNELLPLATVAVFNSGEEEKTYCFSVSDIGLKQGEYVFTDVWNGDAFVSEGNICVTLKPHCSKLMSVNKSLPVTVYDANAKVVSAELADGALHLRLSNAKTAQLTLSRAPSKVTLNGEDVKFTLDNKVLSFDLPSTEGVEAVIRF